jgi:tRNA pseudouridine32 synthase / 23S rRNA pseudouridine746 synthase
MKSRTCRLVRRCAVCFALSLAIVSALSALEKQSTTSTQKALPPSELQTYLLDRNVTVRNASWLHSMLPLQVYRGKRVQARVADPTIPLSEAAKAKLDRAKDLSKERLSQLEMQLAAETRASLPLDPKQHLHILYCDEHICVTSKPSGILSVPGSRRNPSLATLVHDVLKPDIRIDRMVVHRIDMDTSGIVVYALTEQALKQLHNDFRERRVSKSYQALLCGHLLAPEMEVDVSLERDPSHPPFMRVARQREEVHTGSTVHTAFQKYINKEPKPSLTTLTVKSWEYLNGSDGHRVPVTRVELTPHTGRTHQLRVHAAAIGFPMVGDDIYGYLGEGHCGIEIVSYLNSEQLHQRIRSLGLNLCLHAQKLSFSHPVSGAPMSFECEVPF